MVVDISARGIEYLKWANIVTKRFTGIKHNKKNQSKLLPKQLVVQRSQKLEAGPQEFPAIKDDKLQGQVQQLQIEVTELKKQVKLLSRVNTNPYSPRLRRKLY